MEVLKKVTVQPKYKYGDKVILDSKWEIESEIPRLSWVTVLRLTDPYVTQREIRYSVTHSSSSLVSMEQTVYERDLYPSFKEWKRAQIAAIEAVKEPEEIVK